MLVVLLIDLDQALSVRVCAFRDFVGLFTALAWFAA